MAILRSIFGMLKTLVPRLKRANFGHVQVGARLRVVNSSFVGAGGVRLP